MAFLALAISKLVAHAQVPLSVAVLTVHSTPRPEVETPPLHQLRRRHCRLLHRRLQNLQRQRKVAVESV